MWLLVFPLHCQRLNFQLQATPSPDFTSQPHKEHWLGEIRSFSGLCPSGCSYYTWWKLSAGGGVSVFPFLTLQGLGGRWGLHLTSLLRPFSGSWIDCQPRPCLEAWANLPGGTAAKEFSLLRCPCLSPFWCWLGCPQPTFIVVARPEIQASVYVKSCSFHVLLYSLKFKVSTNRGKRRSPCDAVPLWNAASERASWA